jgi:hypothetical protein
MFALFAMEGWPPASSVGGSSEEGFGGLITTTTMTRVEEIKNVRKMFVEEGGVEEIMKSVRTVWESKVKEGGREEEEEEVVKDVEEDKAAEETEEEAVGETTTPTSSTVAHNRPVVPSLFVVTKNKIDRYSTLFRPLSSIQTEISQPRLSLPAGVEIKDVIVEKVLEEGVVVDKELRKGFRKVMKNLIRRNEERFEEFMTGQ